MYVKPLLTYAFMHFERHVRMRLEAQATRAKESRERMLMTAEEVCDVPQLCATLNQHIAVEMNIGVVTFFRMLNAVASG